MRGGFGTPCATPMPRLAQTSHRVAVAVLGFTFDLIPDALPIIGIVDHLVSERINACWLTRFRGFHFRVSGLGAAETGEAPKRIPYEWRRG